MHVEKIRKKKRAVFFGRIFLEVSVFTALTVYVYSILQTVHCGPCSITEGVTVVVDFHRQNFTCHHYFILDPQIKGGLRM
jgi:hypothetical protein